MALTYIEFRKSVIVLHFSSSAASRLIRLTCKLTKFGKEYQTINHFLWITATSVFKTLILVSTSFEYSFAQSCISKKKNTYTRSLCYMEGNACECILYIKIVPCTIRPRSTCNVFIIFWVRCPHCICKAIAAVAYEAMFYTLFVYPIELTAMYSGDDTNGS